MFKVEGSELLERLLLLRTRMGAVRANHPPSTPNSPGHTPSTIPTTPGARERPRPSQTVTTAGVWSKTVDFLKNRTPLTMDGERPRVDSVASAVLETYSRLGTKGKPKRRNNGAKEWTVLAGFCLCYKGEEEQWDVRCIALGWVGCCLLKGESELTTRSRGQKDGSQGFTAFQASCAW